MLAKGRPKRIRIVITTYTKPKRKYIVDMSKAYGSKNENNSRFICSICLNTKARHEELKHHECDRRKSKSCPICKHTDLKIEPYGKINKTAKDETHVDDNRIRNAVSPEINADQGLNLLTEVLTVFQSQKDSVKDRNTKPIVQKDACVSAEFGKAKPKLSVSKTFKLSIEGGVVEENGKFYLVNAYQPDVVIHSQCSIDLIKHKSSSIPQMRMEELKNALKEKSKTNKDAIEEVNRMFATVKRDNNFDNVNRPLIRNGPRVLPVVKTSGKPSQRSDEDSLDPSHKETYQSCLNGQNYYMSSGDSVVKRERCDKSVNVECCNKNHIRIPKEIVCERCRKASYVLYQ